MLPSFNETKYNSHWQLCSLEELGRGKSKHRQGMITDYFWENIPLFRLGTSKLQIFGFSSYRTSRTRKPTSSDVG